MREMCWVSDLKAREKTRFYQSKQRNIHDLLFKPEEIALPKLGQKIPIFDSVD